MFGLSGGLSVLLFLAPADMRKSFDTLAALVKEAGHNPLSGDIFVFVGKGQNRVKILWWFRGGFNLLARRLEEGTFSLPLPGEDTEIALQLDMTELNLLMEGIDLGRIRRRKIFIPKIIDKETSLS